MAAPWSWWTVSGDPIIGPPWSRRYFTISTGGGAFPHRRPGRVDHGVGGGGRARGEPGRGDRGDDELADGHGDQPDEPGDAVDDDDPQQGIGRSGREPLRRLR